MESKKATLKRALEALRCVTRNPPEETPARPGETVAAVPSPATSGQPPCPDGFDALDPLREPFVRWLDDSVVWSARWCTSLRALHNSCAEWIARQDQVPPDPQEFRQLLTELGSIIHLADDLVLGIALREDVQAHERFQAPAPPPPPPALAATERAINPAWRRK